LQLPPASEFVGNGDKSCLKTELDEAAKRRAHYDSIRQGLIPTPAPLPAGDHDLPPGRTHLVIGDAHAKPSVTNERFEWLGRMIEAVAPDVVVAGGDWFDMPSLCYYDKGKYRFEGRRYWEDIDAGIDALLRLRAQLSTTVLNTTEFHFLLGNHEERIIREISNNPGLIGAIDPVRDFMAQELGWTVHGFLDPVELDGITYSHYPDKGGRAPSESAKHLAASGLAFMHKSCVFFHTHRFDYFAEPHGSSAYGHIACVYAGCYFLHWEDWAGSSNRRWHRGILTLNNVHDGVFGHQWTTMDEIRQVYGKEQNRPKARKRKQDKR
jgi:hypothetical protein